MAAAVHNCYTEIMTRLMRNPTPGRRYIPAKIKHEETIQRQICSYLKLQYPLAIFRSDYASGLHLTLHQAAIHKSLQSGRAWPDLFIYEPRVVNGIQYAGLALELKRDGTTIIVKIGERKGHLTSDPHIQEQFLMLRELKSRGYYANFAVGFDEAQRIIDWYMGKSIAETKSLF